MSATRPKSSAKKKSGPSILRPKKGPQTLPCGCNSTGHRCLSEERLGGDLDSALAAFRASDAKPGDADFPSLYRPLLKARQVYHAHFQLLYDPQNDPLLQEHRCLQQDRQSTLERMHP